METLKCGLATITYNSDWVGDATIQWTNPTTALEESFTLPGKLCFMLLTYYFNEGHDTPETIAASVDVLKKDFEFLRRQAELLKRQVFTAIEQQQGAIAQLTVRVEALE